VADSIGVFRPDDAYTETLKTAGGPLTAWFADVRLRLGFPSDSNIYEWTTAAGFVPKEALPKSFPSGILGNGGGLDRFMHTELITSTGGVEMPVVRVFTAATESSVD
jgi:hypothetical protein